MAGPIPPEIQLRALQNAYAELLAGLKTEPMTISELAGYWNQISRPLMRRVLQEMPDAEQLPAVRGGTGRLWRVPLIEMPPRYLVDVGLLAPPELPADNKRQQSATSAEPGWTRKGNAA